MIEGHVRTADFVDNQGESGLNRVDFCFLLFFK